MKKIFGFIFITTILNPVVFANDGDYAVSKIAPALLKNANAVLRVEEIRFEILNTSEAVERNHYVITILNENGDRWAEFADYYDKLREIRFVEGFLYDADGKQLKKMKFKDLLDLSGVDDMSLMSDNRIKRHNFYYKVYPYTIEYDEEIFYKNTLFFPEWIPQGNEKLSVEKSHISIVCPADYKFRYKSYNYKGDALISSEKDKKVSTWSAENMSAMLKEPNAPDWYELTTVVFFAPTDFEIEKYNGNMASWQDFGKFVFSLKQGRDVLPADIKQTIHQLTDGISDVKKKIQLLYEFMQKNTRYISIQLGIGGWQPFDATYVATKGYGDCKALTNYMFSILKEAGIPSYYTVIKAGRSASKVMADFPSQQFNHVILSVPLAKDTMWLECTSQTLPAGYLSDFTSDRYALMVNENGGKLIRTPKYGLNDNIEVRKVKAILDEDATLTANVTTRYQASQQDILHQVIHFLSKDKVKEYLHNELNFATYDVTNFNYEEEKKEVPSILEKLDISVSNYASITGKRLFIMPNVMSRSVNKLKSDEERKYDIVLRQEYQSIDTVEIEIPKGYMQESIPKSVSIESKYGKYSCSAELSSDKIFYYREMEQYSGTFPAKEYSAIVDFYDAIYKADRNKIVLVKKESM
jgi:hypothetical protein